MKTKLVTLDLTPYEIELLYLALNTYRPIVRPSRRQQMLHNELVAELHDLVLEDDA